jgi:glycosyltransferase involved in cell wall biosynthesis
MNARLHSATELVSPSANVSHPVASTDETIGDDRSLPGIFLMTDSFDTGGSERQFAALAKSLDPHSFRLHLGCIQKRGAFLDGLNDVQEFPLGGSLYRIGSLQARWKLGRHMRQNAIDIAHAFDFYTNLTLIPAARLARVPVVIGSQRQLGDLLSPAQFRAQLAVLRWSDAVVCNSRAAAERLVANGLPKDKTVVISNGLPASCFVETEPALPRRSGLLRVGMIARMNTPSKNHRLFLRAAARLVSKFGDLKFVLVGDGPLRSELESEAEKLGIRHQTQFLGDRRDIPAVLASLDITVLPSVSESLSNAIIESMAAGVPVIANRVGGNPELVDESRGILVAPNDEAALSGAVECLLRDAPLRIAMGRNAKEFAKANFTIDHMRQQHEGLYAELLEKKRWKPSTRSSRSFSKSRTTSTRLRVAIVAASLRYVGGQSVQADLLLRNWKHDPDVSADLIPIDPLFPKGLQWIERIPLVRTIVREPLYMLELWRGLKNTDIVHIFSASYWSFLVAPVPAWLIARLRGKKTLIHYHSGEARDHLRRFRTARPILAKADMLVVPSGYLVDVFREFDLQAKAVPNIVDLTQFSFRIRKSLRPHLVCTRGFHPYYSVDVVVRAFAKVLKAFPGARLDLVGGGPEETKIRNLVKELGISGVNFCGVAAYHDIARFYDQADIFINASCLDNMPVSVIEAFASGTPVVSTAPESMPYLVDHERTGLLSAIGDEHALAANVVRLMRDPELAQRLTSNAREESCHYSWPSVREQWIQVYRSLSSENVSADTPTSGT